MQCIVLNISIGREAVILFTRLSVILFIIFFNYAVRLISTKISLIGCYTSLRNIINRLLHESEKFYVFSLVPLRSNREKTEFLTLVKEIPDLQ
jgi:hypothetical protein